MERILDRQRDNPIFRMAGTIPNLDPFPAVIFSVRKGGKGIVFTFRYQVSIPSSSLKASSNTAPPNAATKALTYCLP